MITFSIPDSKSGFTSFNVEAGSVLFAGSRYMSIQHDTCSSLIEAFGALGFSFLTGCASGVDASFRRVMSESRFRESSLVACAFKSRRYQFKGVHSMFVVPEGIPPRAALAKRTLWMTSHCSMLILFPSHPMGRGSHLAFKSAIYSNKPVFIVSDRMPEDSNLYTIHKSNLFGVVQGYWCIPYVYQQTGLCHETV